MSLADDLSIQLYSFRHIDGLERHFEALAALGYTCVEPYGGLFSDVAELKAMLTKYRMRAPTAHVGLDLWRKDAKATAKLCRDLGVEVAFAPAPPMGERDKDAAGWQALGRELAAINAIAKAEGLKFGWHNHHWEYGKAPDGRTFLELMFAEAPEISWQADFAWAIRGGGDPLAEIARHGSRLVSCHVKDLAAAGQCLDEDGWADPGHGTMGWPVLASQLKQAGVKFFVAEHDKPSDPVRFARRAREAAAAWG